jgi:GNAT superfamily N-acetyltransferase
MYCLIPTLVTDADCEAYLFHRGKGWVCEMDGIIVGFAIADLQEENIWALFLKPEAEGKGIASQLTRPHAGLVFFYGKDNSVARHLPRNKGRKFLHK